MPVRFLLGLASPSSTMIKLGRTETRIAFIIYRSLILVLAACGIAYSQVPKWSPQGPGPTTQGQVENITNREVVGAINALATHPTNANIVYVGAVNGGVWRTTNAMSATPAWIPLTDNQSSLSIGALEFDPTDATAQTLVAGIGRFSSLNYYGGIRAGLLRTINGGGNWTLISGGGALNGLNVSGIAPRGSTLIISVNNADVLANRGIWRSLDSGATWTQISGLPGAGLPTGASFDLAGDPANSARLFANAGTNGLYRSTDTGATWTKVSNAAMDALILLANNIEIAVGTSNNVYIAIVNAGQLAGLFRSGDGGATWAALDLPGTVEGGVFFGIHPGQQGSLHLSIAADPANANIMYVGGDRQPAVCEGNPMLSCFPNSIGAWDYSGRLFRVDASQPAGSQAVPLTHSNTAQSSAPHADSRDMKFAANGDLVEVDDGGVYRRTSPQTNTGDWFSMNGDIQTTEFHSVAWDANSHVIIGGAQDTGTPEQLQPSNVRWQDISTGDGGVVAVDDSSTPGFSTRYSSYYGLNVFMRQVYNASNAFVSQAFPALTVTGTGAALQTQFYTPVKLNTTAPKRLIIGGWNSVYESMDQGDTITEIGPGIRANSSGRDTIAYGAAGNADMLYVGSGAQVFVRTAATPAALTASATYPGTQNVTAIAIDPDNPQTAYVLDAAAVYQTTDAGGTWTTVTGNLTMLKPGILRSLAYSPVDRALAVGTDSGVFWALGPAFTTWAPLGSGLPTAPVYHLEYDAANRILLAGTLGRGAWTLDLGVPRDACLPSIGGLGGQPTLDGVVSGDPGWNNALQLNLSGDLGSTSATKMLLGVADGFVYLGLMVSAPVVDQNTTVVLVFSPDGNPVNDWRFHIQPFDATLANVPNPFAVTWWRDSSTWNTGVAGTAANSGDWQKDNIKFGKTSSNYWELEFRIPIASTAPASSGICFNCGAGGLFKMYVNILNTMAGTVQGVPPAVSQDVWPPCPLNTPCGSIISGGLLTQSTPSSQVWGIVSLGGRPACTGVSLTWDKVGVQDPGNASNLVQLIRRFNNVTETTLAQCQALADNANPGSNGPVNVFAAKPVNNMSTQAQVSVRFRMANWGIPGTANFSYLGSPFCSAPDSSNCSGVSSNPTATQTIPGSSTGNFNTTTWSLSYKQSCFYKISEHQCIQVEMDSDDPSTRFLNRSVQRNMDFVPGSAFRRTAHISGDQGPLLSGQTKHRFLLMVDADQQGPVFFPTLATETGRKNKLTLALRDRDLAALAKRHFSDEATNLLAWILRGYVYTGNNVIINGQGYEWVRRVGDFGYVVGHAGLIAGWTVQIKNPELREVRPGFYALEVAPGHEALVETVITPQPIRRLAWFIHIGANFPHGALSNTNNPGFSLNSGIEYTVTRQFSLEGIFGYHRLNGATGIADKNLFQISVNGKLYVGNGPLRGFVNGGTSVYHFSPGSVTRPGVNAGGGLQYSISARVALEGAYNLHSVFTTGTSTLFSTVQGGAWFKF